MAPSFARTRKALARRPRVLVACCALVALCLFCASAFNSSVLHLKEECKSCSLVELLSRPEADVPHECHARQNHDIPYPPLASQSGSPRKTKSAAECCRQCIDHFGDQTRCNVWVFNEQSGECWLKHLDHRPELPITYSKPFTTAGTLYSIAPYASTGSGEKERCVQTILTSDGNAYLEWQTRVLLQTYFDVRKNDSLLKHFTRVLHSDHNDSLSGQIPTVLVPPPKRYPSYGVAERSGALDIWSRMPGALKCSHLFFVETDYLFVKDFPASILPDRGYAIGFPYGYIDPAYPTVVNITKRYTAVDPIQVPPTGIAPLLIHADDFARVVPIWAEMHHKVEEDPEAVKDFGWVRDMYSFSYSAANAGLKVQTALPPYNPFMDYLLGDAISIHYTWGPIISINGTTVWSFDKRSWPYSNNVISLIPPLPPWDQAMRLQAGEVVTKGHYNVFVLFTLTFNEAAKRLNNGLTKI